LKITISAINRLNKKAQKLIIGKRMIKNHLPFPYGKLFITSTLKD
jgi:hypothetical protein